jgi:hypothetical protein
MGILLFVEMFLFSPFFMSASEFNGFFSSPGRIFFLGGIFHVKKGFVASLPGKRANVDIATLEQNFGC